MRRRRRHGSRRGVYQYLPLEPGTIRLLKLLPSTADEPITCTIVHETFNPLRNPNIKELDCPQYCALSYEWGSPTHAKRIRVDQNILHVRDNLWQFLRRLRHQSSSRTLWVDAICINQNDLTEKTSQVAIMGSIFRHATDVLAWVGQEADDSAFLMNLALSSRSLTGELGIAQLNCAAERRRTWEALRAFFNRSYWSRTWIMQEIVLAKQPILVFCGSDMVPYDDLYGMNEMLNTRLNDLSWLKSTRVSSRKKKAELDFVIAFMAEHGRVDLPTLLSYGTTYNAYGPIEPSPGSLISLIYKYAHTNCSDPRDKVFALLEMADDIDLSNPPAWFDYSKEPQRVFFEVLACYAPNHESLTNLGEVLMQSMNLTPESLRDYVSRVQACEITAKTSTPSVLSLRLPVRFGCGVAAKAQRYECKRTLTVTHVEQYIGSNIGDTLLFEIDLQDKGPYDKAGPLTRGIAYDINCGDAVCHVNGSDVALVFRRHENVLLCISWALLEVQQWQTNAIPVKRLTYLRRPPNYDSAMILDAPHISYPSQLLIGLDLPVLVTVIEGTCTVSRADATEVDLDTLPSTRGLQTPRTQLRKSVYRYFRSKRDEWLVSLFWHISVMHNISKCYKKARGIR